MVQLTKIEDYYYITISTDVDSIRIMPPSSVQKDLHSLASGGYEDIYDNLSVAGPLLYHLLRWPFYLTEHRIPGHSVWQFDVGRE